jgi:plastocyanin
MKTRFGIVGATLASLVVSIVTGQLNDPMAGLSVNLSADVTLISPKSGTPKKDASRVVEWLVPKGSDKPVQIDQAKTKYRMLQHDKTFEPNFLVVPVGSVVDFPNLDPWFHNVFSLYRGKKFDLGLYEAGSDKEVRFDRPGASYVFCNIHPEMTAVVLTVDSKYFGVSDKVGHISISGVPAGHYIFHVWYENASQQTLQALERPIDVNSETHTLPTVSIVVTSQDLMKHKNKYGRDYDPDAANPVY